MLKSQEDIPIDNEEPFKYDQLEREAAATNLTTIVTSYSGPLTLSVNAPWGHGKTTFLKMWAAQLHNEGHLCIFYNAWENDFSDQPFFSFISELENFIQSDKTNPTLSAKFDKFLGHAKLVGKYIFKKGAPLLIRLTTGDVLNVSGKVEEITSNALANATEDAITTSSKQKDDILKFKASLENFAQELKKSKTFKPPLIIFVDELDRCRPPYAIELLETIKHLFSVNGICFILGIDRDQLSYSVKTLYGQEMDADGYLKKFSNHEFALPSPTLENFCTYQLSNFNIKEVFNARQDGDNEFERFNHALFGLIKDFNPDLRTIGQVFSRINIVIRSIPPSDRLHVEIIPFLITIKATHNEFYKSLANPHVTVDLDTIKMDIHSKELLKSIEWKTIEVFLKCIHLSPNEIHKELRTIGNNIDQNAYDSRVSFKMEQEIQIYNHFINAKEIFEILIGRIEFSQGFI